MHSGMKPRPFAISGILRLSPTILAAALILSAWPAPAHASTITFNLAGTFVQGINRSIAGNFSGSITIDTTTGLVSSFSFTDPYATFGGACVHVGSYCTLQPAFIPGYVISARDSSNDSIQLLVTQSSLIGVTTLTLVTSAFGAGNYDSFSNGSVHQMRRAAPIILVI